MGRAKSQTQAVAAVSTFNTILGKSRGSADAQAQRDISEIKAREVEARRQRDNDLEEFVVSVDGVTALTRYRRLGHEITTLLVNAYKAGISTPGVPGHASLLSSLYNKARQGGDYTLLAVCAKSDPVTCPGLTVPAVLALGKYFTAASESSQRHEFFGFRNPITLAAASQSIAEQAEQALDLCSPLTYEGDEGLAECQRLQPLYEGIGYLIARSERFPHDEQLTHKAANLMGLVSEEVLAGPLSSWVGAFIERADAGRLSLLDRTSLLNTCRMAAARFPLAATALAPLAKRLQKLI